MSFYEDLELTKNATEDEIRKAYKKLSLKYHPDKPGGSQEHFVRIQKAYTVLTDPNKKSYFDSTGKDPDNKEEDNSQHMANNMFAQMFSMHGMAGLFGGLNGMGGMHARGPQIDMSLPCTYDELIYGGKKTATHNGQKKRMCNACIQRVGNMIIRNGNCQQCQGRGVIIENGKEVTINVDVPAKSYEGKVVTVNGPDGPNGSNKINIQLTVEDTKDFMHINNVIVYKYSLNVYQALLGVEGQISYGRDKFSFKHDKPISPKTPQDHSKGEIHLPERGMYDEAGQRGDLIIIFDIEFPETITDRERVVLTSLLNKTYS